MFHSAPQEPIMGRFPVVLARSGRLPPSFNGSGRHASLGGRPKAALDFAAVATAAIVVVHPVGSGVWQFAREQGAGSTPAAETAQTIDPALTHDRRKGVHIICHRGASEHAHENTLEAFRATFELGGDGNEFDIRATKDGVLVVFHDDMLDRLLDAYGRLSDYTWEELQRFRFRDPGPFGEQCRIPTLVEVFELHRRYRGLMHLDIKVQGIDRAIADLLTRMNLWDQVAYCNAETGGVILRDRRFKECRYKASLYLDRGEVFPEVIAQALKRPGNGLILEEPSLAALALGRKLHKLSTVPVSPKSPVKAAPDVPAPSEEQLITILRDAGDWDRVAQTAADRAASSKRIRARARARNNCWRAEQLRQKPLPLWKTASATATSSTRIGSITVSMARWRCALILLGAARRRARSLDALRATTRPSIRSSTPAGKIRGAGRTFA